MDIDLERYASEFNAGYYRGLLEKSWGISTDKRLSVSLFMIPVFKYHYSNIDKDTKHIKRILVGPLR